MLCHPFKVVHRNIGLLPQYDKNTAIREETGTPYELMMGFIFMGLLPDT